MDLGADAFDGRHGVETAALGAPIVPKRPGALRR